MKEITVIGLPLYTLSAYAGMGRSPQALRGKGLLTELGPSVHDYEDAQIPSLKEDVVEGKIKNLAHFNRSSDIIIRRTRELEPGDLVLCLGGECSFTVGALAGLGSTFKGKPGMLWIDSHGDFNTPETSPSGYIGGMCLAMACGRGPRLEDSVEREMPLLEEERLIHLGSRALDQAETETMRSSKMGLYTMKAVQLEGIKEVAAKSAKRLADSADWLDCHLDVDVLDPSVVPSVNYPTPGGMTSGQVVTAIKALDATGKLRVLEVAAYNPALDKDGTGARAVISILRDVVAR